MPSGYPTPSSASVSRRMARTLQRDTPPEQALRKAIHKRGLRYRVHALVPGVDRARPDILFPTEKVAVYVDGCFWHSCPEHATQPSNNADWWRAKLNANQARDQRHTSALQACGWTVLRFWEHEDPTECAVVVEQVVVGIRHRPGFRETTDPSQAQGTVENKH